METKKTKYLSYIEEHRKHHSVIEEVAKISSKKAIIKSHAKSIPVTFLEGEDIVQIDKDGKKKVIGTVKNNRRKVDISAKSKLPKK